MGSITGKQLSLICPRCPADKVELFARCITAACAEAQINTVVRAASFIGQWAHETGEFRWMLEQTDGSEYEGRKDLGNTEPGDGARFKGRGPPQLTGRDNYHACGAVLGLPLEEHPEMVEQPEVGFRAAAWFWSTRHLNALADAADFIGMTHAINGGLNGLEQRVAYTNKALAVLGRDVVLFSSLPS